MFDPFGDFEIAGYLRNTFKEKGTRIVKRLEHDLFEVNFEHVVQYLLSFNDLSYKDFLAIHQLLFSELYHCAGKDRSMTAPTIGVSKGETLFARPDDARFAVIEGLRSRQVEEEMIKRPGEVMGLFAYGHPFLDGLDRENHVEGDLSDPDIVSKYQNFDRQRGYKITGDTESQKEASSVKSRGFKPQEKMR